MRKSNTKSLGTDAVAIQPQPASAPGKVRTVDPAIQALRDQHAAAVAAYRLAEKSGKVLAGIVQKLDKLTPEDMGKLVVEVRSRPSLPKNA